MAISQNGWPVIEKGTSKYLTTVPFIIGKVRKDGGVAEIFKDLLLWFDKNIEDIGRSKDDWGWSPRPIRGQTTGYSNHASGTAIDINALLHPRGAINTFNAAQRAAIRKRLKNVYKGVIRWGGDYNLNISVRDDMHFEIDADAARIAAVLKNLGSAPAEKPVKPKPSQPKPTGTVEKVWQNSKNSKQDNIEIAKLLNFLGFDAGYPDGIPGPRLRDGVKAYQSAQLYFPGMKADGDWAAMTQAHFEWVRDLQGALNEWAASKRLGILAEDGNYLHLTGKHVHAVQKANPDLYKKAGGNVYDEIAGPVFCKMLGIKKHPSA